MKALRWMLLALLGGTVGCSVMNGDGDGTSTLPGGPGGAESVTSAETGVYTYKGTSCPIEVLKKGPAAVHLDSEATFTIEVTFGKDVDEDQFKVCSEMLKRMQGDKVGIPVTDTLPDSLAFASAKSDDSASDLCSISGVPSNQSGECGVTGQDLWWNAHFKEVKTTVTLTVVTKVVKECIPPAVIGLAPYLDELADWNLVAWGDSHLYDSDVEGYALFGGSLEAKSYSFGLLFAGAANALSTWAVAAYGAMDLENVGVWGGKAGTMGSVIQEVGVTVYDDPGNEYHVRAMLPAEFYALFNHYGHALVANGFGSNLANCMGQTPCPSAGSSCVLANDNHTILCTGSGTPIFFNLPETLFIPDVTEVVFVVDRQAEDLAPTMVINLEGDWSGTPDDPLDMRVSMRVVDADGIAIEGAASKMLWNIRGVPYLDMHSTNFLGSLLGPGVNLSAYNSLISGQVFVTTITGDVQIDWVPFDGTFLPPPVPQKCKNTAVVKSEGGTIESTWEFEVLAALT